MGTSYRAYHAWMQQLLRQVNPDVPEYLMKPFDYELLCTRGPAVVGSPAEVAERIAGLGPMLGADVHVAERHGVTWVDGLCEIEHEGRRGFCCLEASNNPRGGTAPVRTAVEAALEQGLTRRAAPSLTRGPRR